jgi:hypothetical protein
MKIESLDLELTQVAGYDFSPPRRRVFAEFRREKNLSVPLRLISLRLCGEIFHNFDNRQLGLEFRYLSPLLIQMLLTT